MTVLSSSRGDCDLHSFKSPAVCAVLGGAVSLCWYEDCVHTQMAAKSVLVGASGNFQFLVPRELHQLLHRKSLCMYVAGLKCATTISSSEPPFSIITLLKMCLTGPTGLVLAEL